MQVAMVTKWDGDADWKGFRKLSSQILGFQLQSVKWWGRCLRRCRSGFTDGIRDNFKHVCTFTEEAYRLPALSYNRLQLKNSEFCLFVLFFYILWVHVYTWCTCAMHWPLCHILSIHVKVARKMMRKSKDQNCRKMGRRENLPVVLQRPKYSLCWLMALALAQGPSQQAHAVKVCSRRMCKR